MSRKSLSLYLHIPFCAARCSYCDFNIYTGLEKLVPAFTQALVREVEGWGVALGHPPVRTLYVGGGTPSLLPLPELEAILRACSKSFTLDSSVEVSLEANPDDLTRQHAEGLLALGVSRLSIGMQTFDDALLRRLGRTHTGEEAKRAFVAAREAGHRNINLDLIYGLPGQDLPAWQLALEQALEMGPEHLSLYGLTVEEGTPLWRQVDRGKVSAPDPDVAAEMYELAQGVLGGRAINSTKFPTGPGPGMSPSITSPTGATSPTWDLDQVLTPASMASASRL